MICPTCKREYKVSINWWFIWLLTTPLRILIAIPVMIGFIVHPAVWYQYWKSSEIHDQEKWTWLNDKD